MSLPCFRCNYSGTIVTKSKINNQIYTFRCGCRFSIEKRISNQIPEWNRTHEDSFLADFMTKPMPEVKKIQQRLKTESESQEKEAVKSTDDDDVIF